MKRQLLSKLLIEETDFLSVSSIIFQGVTNMYRIERWREAYKPNAARLRQIMVSEGYRVFQWSDSPSTVYPIHKHDNEQSHWIISGKLELTIENVGTFVLGPGDRDFMPAGTYHSARVVSDEPVIYLIGEKF
ncbi:MAG: cupin domain-containing protein [Pyrinomonadaceae bacterium]|nr:cupin domain-containing protein [Pyrinomonadaceae bacterium]